jgi:hypothetical protein
MARNALAEPTAQREQKARIFDHMSGEPEDARFSRVAWAMRKSAWWSTTTVRGEDPAPAAGEIVR